MWWYTLAQHVPVMPIFDDALARLPATIQAQVTNCLATWGVQGGDWAQIAINMRSECALALQHMESLLTHLAEALATDPDQDRAWCSACKSLEFHGAEVPAEKRPAKLGRAWRVGSFAGQVSGATNHLSQEQAERLTRKYAGKMPPPERATQLRGGKLGWDLMWGTFHLADSSLDPFSCLPERSAAVRCAMGLGRHPDADILVLTYTTAAPAHGLPLHRPTVADANTYAAYRPHHDPAAHHGYTAPLAPNADSLPPMPEVVHRQVGGAALIFPYRIFV